jgi:DNA-binding IclR family transcriptional regulator
VENPTFSIRELAKEVNLPRSIVHRLILTLKDECYNQKNSPQPGYRLGSKLWSFGYTAIQGSEIRDIARPFLEDLSSKTTELVTIGVLDDRAVVYLDKIDSSQAVPAYCISTGKAILAYRSDNELMKIASPIFR